MKCQMACVLMSCMTAAGVLQAAVVATESFDYPAGGIPLSGGFGWSQGWQVQDPGSVVVQPGLSYPGVPGFGNAMGPTAQGSFVSRALAAPVSAATHQSMVFAMLVRPTIDGSPASYVAAGHLGSGTFAMGDFADASSRGGEWALQTDGGNHYTGVQVVAGATALLVGRVDFLLGQDVMSMWVNPILDTTSPLEDALFGLTGPDVVANDTDLPQFSAVFFQNHTFSPGDIDEVVIFARPVPAGSTGVAFGLGGAIVNHRRRGRQQGSLRAEEARRLGAGLAGNTSPPPATD